MIYYEGGGVMIRDAVASDIGRMAKKIRVTDAAEVYKSHGHSPTQALTYSFMVSAIKCTIVHRGKPVAMFGVTPDAPGDKKASVWLLGTDGLAGMWLSFLRLTPIFIAWMLEQYPTLYNFVDAENSSSIKWLEWCGARFTEPQPYGEAGHLFRFFVIEKEKAYV